MAVAPLSQRQGIGRQCLAHAVELVVAAGGDAIRLDAYDGAGSAGGFYAACGFREVGRAAYRGTPLVYFETTSLTAER
jgi:ribosomal protein S18 acetylase RimI-like enzyme